MKYTEEQLNIFSAELSMTENEKCKNAIKMVADAFQEDGFIYDGEIEIFFDEPHAFTDSN